MYRIILEEQGKYNNIVGDTRYTFTKRSAKKLINEWLADGCELRVEIFAHLANGVFAWSDDHDLYSGIHYDEEE